MNRRKSGKLKALITVLTVLVFAMLICGISAADAYSELNYGGNDKPLLSGKGSTEISTKDISATWFSGTTSVLLFVYADSPDVTGTVTYTDSTGKHTSKWEIKDGGYGYITNGVYQRSGALNDNYAFITFYPKKLSVSRDSSGLIKTGITVTIDSIAKKSNGSAGSASFDSVGFYVYADSETMNGKFLGSLSHLKKINRIVVMGDNSSVYDCDKKPEFKNYLSSAMTSMMEFSDERRINVSNKNDVISMTKALSGTTQSYTWGAKYKRQFIFTSKAGYRFDTKNITLIFDGTDYSNYIDVSVSNLNKTITITFKDQTGVYAKKAIKNISFVNMNLSLTAGKEPKYTGYVNTDGVRYVDFSQCWKRSSDNRILNGAAESETEYIWSAEFDPGNKFYFNGMPEIKVNSSSLKLYTVNGFPATAKVSGNVLYLDIGGIKSSKGKATPTPGSFIPGNRDADDPLVPVITGKSGDGDSSDKATPTPTKAPSRSDSDPGIPSVVPGYDDPNDATEPAAPYAGENNKVMDICILIALLSLLAMIVVSGRREKE